jgi:hypothetical protein
MARKLIVRLKGGLGNQLFCYAAARRLAMVNDAELVLDAITGFKYDHLYHRNYALGSFHIPARMATSQEQMEPLGRFRRLIERKISERKPLAKRRYIQQVGVDFDPDIVTLRLQEGSTYFDAFGQSELYFFDIRKQLKQDLVMSEPVDQANQEMAKKIGQCPSVALHFRWFDAGVEPQYSNMSLAYYAQAVDQLISCTRDAHFYIFSDLPEQTVSLLAPLLKGKPYTVVAQNKERGNAAADFWLMRQCRHFIIGNSTFAWWAAWLAEQSREDTQVFAPSKNVDPLHSVTAWGFPGLLPERWTIL